MLQQGSRGSTNSGSATTGRLRVSSNARMAQQAGSPESSIGSLGRLSGGLDVRPSTASVAFSTGGPPTVPLNLEERARAMLSRKSHRQQQQPGEFHASQGEASKGYETVRGEMTQSSLEKLKRMAETRFGSMQHMLEAFGKDAGDELTLDELSLHLRRRNLDMHFTRQDQRLIFEGFDAQHEDSLPVSYLLRFNHAPDQRAADYSERMAHCRLEEIKSRFSEAVERHRVEKKLPLSQPAAEQQIVNSLSQDADCHEGRIEVGGLRRALAKQLRLDLPEDDVAFLLERARRAKGDRLGFWGLLHFMRVTDMDLDACQLSDARAATVTLIRRRLKALNASTDEMERRLGGLRDTLSEDAAAQRAQHERLLAPPSQTHLDTTDLDPAVSSQSLLPAPHGGGGVRTSLTKTASSRKLAALPPHDWRRIGVGTGSVDPLSSHALPPALQFQSHAAATFAPFFLDQKTNSRYRTVVGDASREERARERVRHARMVRTQRNQELSQAHREEGDLQRSLVQLRRGERMTRSMLAHESRMFLEDLRDLKKQPLNRMARRPNTTAHCKMWGGSVKEFLDPPSTVNDEDTTAAHSYLFEAV